MPHGPAKAVLVAAVDTIHGPAGFGGGGNWSAAGWPESMRVMSGSGPLGPITHGVWQSLQPEVVTMYLPRATLSASGCCATAGSADISAMARAMRFMAFSWGRGLVVGSSFRRRRRHRHP